jgi:hypothetical protein
VGVEVGPGGVLGVVAVVVLAAGGAVVAVGCGALGAEVTTVEPAGACGVCPADFFGGEAVVEPLSEGELGVDSGPGPATTTGSEEGLSTPPAGEPCEPEPEPLPEPEPPVPAEPPVETAAGVAAARAPFDALLWSAGVATIELSLRPVRCTAGTGSSEPT